MSNEQNQNQAGVQNDDQNQESQTKRSNVKKIGEHKYTTRSFFIPKEKDDIDIPDGDPQIGEIIFKNDCSGCHDLDEDSSIGPSLRFVYMRKAKARKNFKDYSKEIPENFYWSKNNLDQFLKDPKILFPNTNMLFDGITDPFDRACLIEYLHYLRVSSSGSTKNQKDLLFEKQISLQ